MTTDYFNSHAHDVELQICRQFSEFFTIGRDIDWDSNTFWTLKVKQLLNDIGRNYYIDKAKEGYSFVTAASGLENQHEWLYDLVWFEYDIARNRLTNVFLVVESEWHSWNKKEYLINMQGDFEKLLLARCTYRLMIFDGYSEGELHSYITHFNSIIDGYYHSQKNDRYMYAAWLNSKEKSEFIFDLKIV
jgi:hypothetical protein